MRITFDTVKNEKNIAERGLSFEIVAELAWETAIAREDVRQDNGECGCLPISATVCTQRWSHTGTAPCMSSVSARQTNER